MNRREYLLIQAASECNEVAHRITKALHFGTDEIEPDQRDSNAERIVHEVSDLIAVLEMLREENILPAVSMFDLERAVALKKNKVNKYINYAIECGTVE